MSLAAIVSRALTCGLVLGMWCGLFGIADGAYVIKLKNGNEYITTRYWHEGKQLMFESFGGVFGVDSAFVSKIDRSTLTVPLATQRSPTEKITDVKSRLSSSTESSETGRPQTESPESKTAGPNNSSTAKEPLKKDDEVMKQYNDLQKRASGLNDQPQHEVRALRSDVNSFRQKLSSSDLAEAHKEEIDAMGSLLRALDRFLQPTSR